MATGRHERVQYTDCFVAFIDILGFSDLVKRSEDDPATLSALLKALNHMTDLRSGTKSARRYLPDGSCEELHWRIQTRAFSDTVVIFMPVETGSIASILFAVRYLHDRMLELDMCMRGAVTIGGMYWNDAWSSDRTPREESDGDVLYERGRDRDFPIALGPGLIAAYKHESECAVYPRILVSGRLSEHVLRENSSCFPFVSPKAPRRALTDYFRTDADGLPFLDLLHPDITRSDTERIVRLPNREGGFSIQWQRDGNTQATVMENVRRLCDTWLNQAECPDKIRAKYAWLKSYADSVVNGHDSLGAR
jgi:hypothetical protein